MNVSEMREGDPFQCPYPRVASHRPLFCAAWHIWMAPGSNWPSLIAFTMFGTTSCPIATVVANSKQTQISNRKHFAMLL